MAIARHRSDPAPAVTKTLNAQEKAKMNDDLDIGATGEAVPHFRFNAKTNEWIDRGEDGEKKMTEPPRFAIDLKNIQTGWLRFDEGTAPDRVVDPAPGVRAERPSERHKRGFVCRIYGRSAFQGVREFSSCAIGLCSAVRDLHREWKAEELGHPGEVPIVAVTGVDAFKSRYGTNYSPRFRITAWIKRPADLPDEPVIPVADGEDVTPLSSQVRRQSNPDPGQYDDLNDDIPFAWIAALIVPWALAVLGAGGVA
jgi:hypothetical protein